LRRGINFGRQGVRHGWPGDVRHRQGRWAVGAQPAAVGISDPV